MHRTDPGLALLGLTTRFVLAPLLLSACPSGSSDLPAGPAAGDTTPPTTPTHLVATGATATTLSLGWTASTDDVGVTGYSVYRDGSRVAEVAAASFDDSGLACGVSYAYAVEAYDAAGNRSAQASLAAATQACMPGDDFPNATNTGVRPGVSLTDSGSVTSTHDGQVISGLNVTGQIVIVHDDVIVEDCRVNCTGEGGCIVIPEPTQVTGVIVRYCEAFALPQPGQRAETYAQAGIGGWRNHLNGTMGDMQEIAFCNVHGVDNALYGGTGSIHDNYAHDFVSWRTGEQLHQDGLQTYGWTDAAGLRFVHNTVIGIATVGDATASDYDFTSSAIALITGMHDVIIADNFLAGGSYTMYGPSQFGQPGTADVHVIHNLFSTEYAARSGYFGPVSGFVPGPGWEWSGNVYHPGGGAVDASP